MQDFYNLYHGNFEGISQPFIPLDFLTENLDRKARAKMNELIRKIESGESITDQERAEMVRETNLINQRGSRDIERMNILRKRIQNHINDIKPELERFEEILENFDPEKTYDEIVTLLDKCQQEARDILIEAKYGFSAFYLGKIRRGLDKVAGYLGPSVQKKYRKLTRPNKPSKKDFEALEQWASIADCFILETRMSTVNSPTTGYDGWISDTDTYMGESDNISFLPEDLQGDDWHSIERRWMLDQARSEDLGLENDDYSEDIPSEGN
ncbi:hypothetical protein HZA97_05955 [Candidatus Woesearchaeota archaeon]|nr:hypothetical protein [Candidatus Woesearchaeota archaeon]